MNSHLKSDSGRELSLFASFFRIVVGFDKQRNDYVYSHAVTWGLTDADAKKYYCYSYLDPSAKEYMLHTIDEETALDRYLCKSLKEVFGRNKLPLPDQELSGKVFVSQDELFLDYGENLFRKDTDGSYHLTLKGTIPGKEVSDCSCDLVVRPLKPPIRNRNNGVVKVGLHGDDMFYYFISRNACSGSVSVAGEEFKVTGTAWYDHEFGGVISAKNKYENVRLMSDNFAWRWVSIQFENDALDLTACVVEIPHKNYEPVDSYSIVVAADGTKREHNNPTFEPVQGKVWRSSQTFVEYPTAWVFKQGDIELELSVDNIPEQELQTLIAFPAFWEGRIKCTGTIAGESVRGLGIIELHGYGRGIVESLKNVFEASSLETRKYIQKLMPLKTDKEGKGIDDDGLRHILGDCGYGAIAGMPGDFGKQIVTETILEPLRDTYDRG